MKIKDFNIVFHEQNEKNNILNVSSVQIGEKILTANVDNFIDVSDHLKIENPIERQKAINLEINTFFNGKCVHLAYKNMYLLDWHIKSISYLPIIRKISFSFE